MLVTVHHAIKSGVRVRQPPPPIPYMIQVSKSIRGNDIFSKSKPHQKIMWVMLKKKICWFFQRIAYNNEKIMICSFAYERIKKKRGQLPRALRLLLLSRNNNYFIFECVCVPCAYKDIHFKHILIYMRMA